MTASFLPDKVKQLRDAGSIAFIKSLKQIAISTPLTQSPITTSCIQQGTGGTPMLFLHGFDSSVLEFSSLVPLLAEQNEVWAVDLLGFGFTERVPLLKITC